MRFGKLLKKVGVTHAEIFAQKLARAPALDCAIFDIETDGLLDALSVVHCLVIGDDATGDIYRFRRNDEEDTILDGLAILTKAGMLVGHNIIDFDIRAIQRVYPFWDYTGKVRDTLPLSRMIFADQKEKDFRLYERGRLPGKDIGTHTLDAWGHRLRLNKGDYKKECEEAGIDPWSSWNEPMEDYCENDVRVSMLLWHKIKGKNYPEFPVKFEQSIHSLMVDLGANGFPFDVDGAQALATELEEEAEQLSKAATTHYGVWFAPDKKRITRKLWDDPDGINESKEYLPVRPEYMEDDSRAVWAEVTIPKKTLNYKQVSKVESDGSVKWMHSRVEGAPFCAVKLKEFNPNSRQQIIDRFTTIHKWEPIDFTETGQPSVNDDVLTALAGKIPMAKELAEIFYLNKRIGQIKTGKNAWLKLVSDEGKIHHYCNTGGTLSGRASHVGPNIAQVPKVKAGKDGKPRTGRDGRHGWECRSLFWIPPHMRDEWTILGADLSGIEFRALAELVRHFDGGELIDVVLNGDIHTMNQEAAGLPTRDLAKTFIYAFIYGGGDAKLGSIVQPTWDVADQKALGAELRAQFLKRMPALAQAIKAVQKQAKRGIITGLDGRRLLVRSPHSALNLKLQSDAALIAKQWCLGTEEAFLDAGMDHGWNGDFAFMAWVHDEMQIAIRRKHIDFAKEKIIKTAADAGHFFNWMCPVDAEAKVGFTWAETH